MKLFIRPARVSLLLVVAFLLLPVLAVPASAGTQRTLGPNSPPLSMVAVPETPHVSALVQEFAYPLAPCDGPRGPRIVESNDGGPYVESPRSWTCTVLPDGGELLESTP